MVSTTPLASVGASAIVVIILAILSFRWLRDHFDIPSTQKIVQATTQFLINLYPLLHRF